MPAGKHFFNEIGLKVRDPAALVMRLCVQLARAETGSGALDWFDEPITELSSWVGAVNELEKKRK